MGDAHLEESGVLSSKFEGVFSPYICWHMRTGASPEPAFSNPPKQVVVPSSFGLSWYRVFLQQSLHLEAERDRHFAHGDWTAGSYWVRL